MVENYRNGFLESQIDFANISPPSSSSDTNQYTVLVGIFIYNVTDW